MTCILLAGGAIPLRTYGLSPNESGMLYYLHHLKQIKNMTNPGEKRELASTNFTDSLDDLTLSVETRLKEMWQENNLQSNYLDGLQIQIFLKLNGVEFVIELPEKQIRISHSLSPVRTQILMDYQTEMDRQINLIIDQINKQLRLKAQSDRTRHLRIS